ncbi:MAG: exodeoxyribonuclease VII large subunit [Dermatophilaceae bacterium]
MKIGEYVDRMSQLWVEGQVVQAQRRPGSTTAFLVLRDPDVDMSLSLTMSVYALDAMATPLREGQRVVVQAKPSFWTRRGSLQLEGRQIRPVGEGELLARIEHLKRVLAAEGVFDAGRKRPLPFLPRRVGLICGRASAAQRDVIDNARLRWPGVVFDTREVPVQGPEAVMAVIGALAELDAALEVDVIVLARGGGSFEDLLPFSNEALVRAVARARTPVVSAIGHEVDTPLVDYAADVRASTPTQAAACIVPDVTEERVAVDMSRARLRRAVGGRLAEERRRVVALRTRPVLADPQAMLAPYRRDVDTCRTRARTMLAGRLRHGRDEVGHLRARVRALSPLSTLQRGYAVVEHADGGVITGRDQVRPDELLRVRVADGDFAVRASG